ncbi:c-type cytochrome [Roseobacter sp.]
MMIVTLTVVSACGRDQPKTGAALFADNCAVCHGADGRGGGGAGVEGLSKTPPDLTQLAVQNGGVFPARAISISLESYAVDGHRVPRLAGMADLQSDETQRVRFDGDRLRTTPPMAALLVYLDQIQAQ